MNLVPGIVPGDPLTTMNEIVYATSPFSGRGFGLGEIDETFGSFGPSLESNRFFNGSDIRLAFTAVSFTDYQGLPTLRNGFNVDINDPAKASVVPEPSTMLLLGMGMVGLVTRIRRKKVA